MISIETATTGHALAMAPFLRDADMREMIMLGYDPVAGLVDMVDRAIVAHAGLEDGLPFVLGGAHAPQLMGSVAYPWMWTAHPAQRLAKHIMRFADVFLDDLNTRYPTLETWVDPEYAGARRLLRWLGFTETGIGTVHGNRMLIVRRDA